MDPNIPLGPITFTRGNGGNRSTLTEDRISILGDQVAITIHPKAAIAGVLDIIIDQG
jgi:hypothetical protein